MMIYICCYMNNIFITGIGTGVGKTIVSACVTAALDANYWKPVQAGLEDGTDSETVRSFIPVPDRVQPELYRLKMPASPHLAAASEGIVLSGQLILEQARQLQDPQRPLVIEGAGGLMVPLTNELFTIDLIRMLEAKVVIVAQNYLGSINHSLLTAMALRNAGIPVLGWIFGGDHHTNEEDIIRWTNYPRLARIPHSGNITAAFVQEQADLMRPSLQQHINAH